MNDEERQALETWTGTLAKALELENLNLDIDAVLNLAGDAARAVVRPAAPVTTFLVGYAAGRADDTETDPPAAVRQAISTAITLMATG